MMKRKKTQAVCVLFLVMLGLASCGGQTASPAEPKETQSSGENAQTETVTEETGVKIEPEDMGGITVTFLGVEPHGKDWVVNTYSEAFAEKENGDPINDAIYRRNMEVEEACNIHIAAEGTERENVGPMALKTILAGDDAYQVVHVTGSSAPTLLNAGNAVYDLLEISTLRLDQPWYDQNSIESQTVGGKLFNVVGDMNLRSFFSSICILMNKQMIMDYALDDPFALVENGTWTIDRLMEMSRVVTADIDGDGKITDTDHAGFFGEESSVIWGLNAFGQQLITSENGTPVITLNNERTINCVEKYAELLNDRALSISVNDVSAANGENKWRSKLLPMLMENRLLFYNGTVGGALDLRSMNSDFGVIPMPKSDEAQASYYSSTHPQYLSFLTIPATNKDPERTGKIVDSMEQLSHEYIVSAVYETTLLDKVLRDAESERMLDIIFANRIYDIGTIFDWGSVKDLMLNLVKKTNPDFSSAYAKREAKIQKAIDAYMALYPSGNS